MDLKSFMIGAVCGGLVVAAVTAVLTHRSDELSESSTRVAERDVDSQRNDTAGAELSSDRPWPDTATVSDPSGPTSSESAAIAVTPTQTPTTNDSLRRRADDLSDADRSTADGKELPVEERSWFAHRRSALMEEPKDDSWAYFTEQAILQFLSNHAAMPEFTLDFIECRSTRCQIGVVAYDENTWPTWQRVMYDMRQQPWYEFGEVGSTWGDVEGRNMAFTELHRLPRE